MGAILIVIYFGLVFTGGWWLTKVMPLKFAKYERWLIAPALGLILLTEIARLALYVVGQMEPMAVLTLVLIIGFLAVLMLTRNEPGEDINSAAEDVVLSWPFWVIVLTIGLYILSVLYFRVLYPAGDGSLLVGPTPLYTDTQLHVSYTSRIAYGSFPPQNPQFAGIPLVYPYMIHIAAALLLHLGNSWHSAFFWSIAPFVPATLVLLVKLWRKFLSNRAVLFAAIIFFLNGGIGGFYVWQKKLTGMALVEFVSQYGDPTHTSSVYNLNFHNIITGMILSERTLLPGLFLGLLLILIFVSRVRLKIWEIGVIGGILGMTFLWHSHTFLVFSAVIPFWILFWMKGDLGEKLRVMGGIGVIGVLVALPAIVPTLGQVDSGFIRWISGWMNGIENIIVYWWRNSFLLIPTAVLGWLFMPRSQKIFFAPSFIIFVLGNKISFSPHTWDNMKLLVWVLVFWATTGAYFLDKLSRRAGWGFMAAIVIIITSGLSGFIALQIPMSRTYVLYDKYDRGLAEWVKENTQAGSVFLTEPIHNHPVLLAGRSIYMGYPGYLWVHGIDYGRREDQVERIYSGKLGRIGDLQPGVDYIVTTIGRDPLIHGNDYPLVYENSKYRVYSL